jgi:carbon storage regulator
MLVLTRKNRESICIGNDIVVTVLEVKGSSIRLGIEAPASVPIWREELFLAAAALVQSEGAAAAPACVGSTGR